jgi:hypothetical protein
MGNLWKQTISGRFKWVLLCTFVLSFAFMGFSFYGASKDDLPTGTVPVTAAARDLPLIDQVVVEDTKFALFALG